MHLDQQKLELLKAHLCTSLNSICDAEPSVLADYIIALLRHDKSFDDLKALVESQIFDFLKEETSPFVTDLFAFLKSNLGCNEPTTFEIGSGDEAESVLSEDEGGASRKHRRIESERKPSYKDAFEDDSTHKSSKNSLCRDFEQNGYCLKGDSCPYQHNEERTNISSSVEVPRYKQRERPKRKELFGSRLIVDKLPADCCSIAKVHDFFSKFGTLINIQLDSASNKAFLNFSSPTEAKKAYRSPEPIFNNRFVKVYWDKRSDKMDREDAASSSTISVDAAKPKVVIPPKIAAQKKKQTNLKALLELQKMKHSLLLSSISQQKLLLAKLSSKNLSEKEKSGYLDALKKIEESIKSISDSIAKDKIDNGSSENNSPNLHEEDSQAHLKATLEKLKSEASSMGLLNDQGEVAVPLTKKSNADRRPMKLDNRSRILILSDIPDSLVQTKEDLEHVLKPLKNIESIEYGSSQKQALVTFSSRLSAETVAYTDYRGFWFSRIQTWASK